MPQKFNFDADDEQSSGSEPFPEPPLIATNKQNNSTDSDYNQQAQQEWTNKLGIKPPKILKSQIESHNQKNHHYKTKISDKAISSDFKVESVRLKQQMLLIDKGYKEVLPPQIPILLKDPDRTTQLITSQQLDLKVRRILSLYQILFSKKSCKFIFQKTDRIRIRRNIRQQDLNQQYLKEEYLKNWFEWVINQSSMSISDPNSSLRLLAYRRQDQLARILVSQQQFSDAEFVSNLQDEQYRLNKGPSQQQLQLVYQCFSPHQTFKDEHWLIHAATMLWFGGQQKQQKMDEILKEVSARDQNEFGIELFLLKQHYKIMPRKLSDFPKVNNARYIPWYWYITQIKTQIYKNIPSFSKHMYFLLHKLITIYDTTKINGTILQNKIFSQQINPPQMKAKIVGKMITTSSVNIQQLQQLKDYSLSTQVQRIKYLYENDRSLDILEEIGDLLKNQQEIPQQQIKILLTIAYRVASQPTILCGYQKSVILQFYDALKKIVELMEKKMLVNQELQNIYLFLGIRLGQLNFQGLNRKAGDILQKMISYCQQMEPYKKFMKNSIFDKIVHNVQAQLAIKQDDKLRKQLQNCYSEDPHKLNKIAEISALK